MELTVLRDFIVPERVALGRLMINGKFFCYTCEDTVREIEGVPASVWKVPQKTAIPRGRYELSLTYSNRFQKVLPLLHDVPCFEGIRIHSGNTAADTEGCILVGLTPLSYGVANSRAAMHKLMPLLEMATARREKMFIEVKNS